MEGTVPIEMIVAGTVVIFLSIAALSWKVLQWLWLTPKKLETLLRHQGLRGNSYRLLYGDMKENSRMIRLERSTPLKVSDDITPRILYSVQNCVKTHGKDSFIWMGPTPRVILTKTSQIRGVLTRLDEFPKKPANPLLGLLGTGLTSYNGRKWANHRKIINPAFRFDKLKRMIPALHLSCEEMLGEWRSMLSVSSQEESCETDVWPHLDKLTSDGLARTAFGSSFLQGRRVFQLLNEQATLVAHAMQSVYVPGLRFLPTKSNKRMKEIDMEIRGLLKGLIRNREKAVEAGEIANDDLLGMFMESNSREVEENGNNKDVGMSVEDVIQECKLFYFAGKETTASLLAWTMVCLGKHPAWQMRAREEVQRVFGDKAPDFGGLSHLKTVTMILHEVLRLYPPAVMLVRTVHEDTLLGDLSLPAGVEVALPIIVIHRDRKLWGENVGEFNPERFSQGASKAMKGQLSYLPFGWGPRTCIGQNFALLEAKMAIAMILRGFEFEVSPAYAHSPVLAITLQPQHGLQLVLRRVQEEQASHAASSTGKS